jgi:hypothetical protein
MTGQDKLTTKIKKMTEIISIVLFMLIICHPVNASVLNLESGVQTVYAGETFSVDWFLDTEDKVINSLDLTLNFSPKTLDLAEVSVGNSLVSLWVEKPYLKEPGKIVLVGGVPGGINGKHVQIFRSVFKAHAAGLAEFSVSESSKILLNDGQGTPDGLRFSPVRFNIMPKTAELINISSPSHSDQMVWYKNNNVIINPNIQTPGKYSYSFSSNIEILPENTEMEVPKQVLYKDMPDGIYYFKLNLKTAENTWQEAAVFRVQIDKTPPESFKPILGQDSSLFGGRKFLSFSTVDKTSGIKGYALKNWFFGKFNPVSSPYQINRPLFGGGVYIKAVDLAGNQRVEFVNYPGYVSTKLLVVIILIFLCFIVLYWYRKIQFLKQKE